MKTEINITIESKNMKPVIEDKSGEDYTKYVEEQLHKAIENWIKEQLDEYTINGIIINNTIQDFEFPVVEGRNELSEYGDLKITLNKEVLCNFTDYIKKEEEE